MKTILASILDFFKAETSVYSHRNPTIEVIALEKNIDIDSIRAETRVILQSKGRVEAIMRLRKRFHVSLSVAWGFVDNLRGL